jgi:hypothetical protein
VTPVQQGSAAAPPASPLSAHPYEDVAIRGAMTLREIEQSTGVPANHIIAALKLPPTTSPDERLGSLKRTYRFEISDVREIVKKYLDENR